MKNRTALLIVIFAIAALVAVIAMPGCTSNTPYVYAEVSYGDTDLDLWEGAGEDADTVMLTLGIGLTPMPVRMVAASAPVALDPPPAPQAEPEPQEEPPVVQPTAWWQDAEFLAWTLGALALIFGGGYSVHRMRRNGNPQ